MGDEFKVDKIIAEDLAETCRVNTASAAGLDGWLPSDLALLSDKGLQILADLLNLIEDGAPWPTSTKVARAVFLPKDPEDTQNPLAYRILKVTPAIYRRWATTRMRHLEDWILTWDHPALHAGIPGKGAFDAWYKTAIETELHLLQGRHVCGASIDVYKCFDQVNRPLLYKLPNVQGCQQMC